MGCCGTSLADAEPAGSLIESMLVFLSSTEVVFGKLWILSSGCHLNAWAYCQKTCLCSTAKGLDTMTLAVNVLLLYLFTRACRAPWAHWDHHKLFAEVLPCVLVSALLCTSNVHAMASVLRPCDKHMLPVSADYGPTITVLLQYQVMY